MPAIETEFDVVVQSKTLLADRVVSLTLSPSDDSAALPWQPGAHIDVILPDGTERQYSLTGHEAGRTWTIAVLREEAGRGGSAQVHDVVSVGDHLRVRGPRNNFALVEAPSYLFIAGGIGITPILPMVAEVEGRGIPWTLVYLGRTRTSMAFAQELKDRYGSRVTIHVDDEDGFADLAQIVDGAAPDAAIYGCGPEGLLGALEKIVSSISSDPAVAERLHIERFLAKAPDPAAVDTAFEVEIASSGAVLEVPADRTILEVLQENDVFISYSCLEGTCGTCETVVLEGEVDHRDSILTPAEKAANDMMYVCVSRANCSRLRLEL